MTMISRGLETMGPIDPADLDADELRLAMDRLRERHPVSMPKRRGPHKPAPPSMRPGARRAELEWSPRGWRVTCDGTVLHAPLRFGPSDREAVERWASDELQPQSQGPAGEWGRSTF